MPVLYQRGCSARVGASWCVVRVAGSSLTVRAHVHSYGIGMKQSKRRRNERRRVLDLWRRELRHALALVRTRLELAPDDVIADDVLIEEAVSLADPDAIPAGVAVIPAPRTDVAERWFEARLTGVASTRETQWQLARDLAVFPVEKPADGGPWGVTREAVERAVVYFKEHP